MRQNRNAFHVLLRTGIVLAGLITTNLVQAGSAETNPPPICEGVGNVQSFLFTDWESGLGQWTAGVHSVADINFFDTPDWDVVGGLPDARAGDAAFVADQENGNCVDDTKAGALTLDSPPTLIPSDAQVPRISIKHWFSTDSLWDGGNFKISVNNGPFNLIPSAFIEVGPYNSTLHAALTDEGLTFNENPLAGQDAFTSTQENPEAGSWGESHINLLGIASAGDTIRLRFDFGVDECGGAIGWYVDDVRFYSCSSEFIPSDTKLTLVKQVINDNSGGATAADWTLNVAGPTPFSGSGPVIASGEGFAAGSYNLSESGGPSGYTASNWVCVGGTQNGATITLAIDEVATCTITNDDQQATLKVVKTIINDDGGLITDPNAFGLKVDGNPVMHNAINAFNAGEYIVSEVGHVDYVRGTWGGDCRQNGSVTLVPGQSATCTITNDDMDLSDIIFRNGFE